MIIYGSGKCDFSFMEPTLPSHVNISQGSDIRYRTHIRGRLCSPLCGTVDCVIVCVHVCYLQELFRCNLDLCCFFQNAVTALFFSLRLCRNLFSTLCWPLSARVDRNVGNNFIFAPPEKKSAQPTPVCSFCIPFSHFKSFHMVHLKCVDRKWCDKLV